MNYPNSPQLQNWLESSGWGIAAKQDTFILDDATFAEQRELLVRNKVPAGHLDDRAAFRCLTLSKVKPAAPAKSEPEALVQQQRQIAERARQQLEHEQALLSSLKETRESSAASADAAASRVTEELRAVILAESTQREYQVSCTQRQVEECIHESRQ